VLPVTVAVGSELEAGERRAITVEFETRSGFDTVSAALDVSPRYGLTLQLKAGEMAGPGSRLRLPFELVSSSNIADSVTLHVETSLGRARDDEQTFSIPPFGTVEGILEIDISHDALPGASLIVVRANGRHASRLSSLEVNVGRSAGGLFGSLVSLPTRLFVGSSIGPGVSGSTFGIEATGDIRPGVRLSVSAHDSPRGTSAFAFRGLQSGSGFRMQLASRSLTAAVGDVSTRTASFAGYRLQGLGAAFDVSSGAIRAVGHVARPARDIGTKESGHQVAGGVDIRTPFATVGLRGFDEQRGPSLLAPAQNMSSAFIRLEPNRPSAHSYLLEAGWLGLANRSTGVRESGPALSGRYSYRDGGTILDVLLRRRPSVAGLRNAGADETRISGLTAMTNYFGLLGEVSKLDDTTEPEPAMTAVVRTAEAGFFIRGGAAHFQLRGRLRDTEGVTPVEDRAIEATLETPAGPGSIDARLEIGRSRSQTINRRLLRSAAGYNLRGSRGWARFGFAYQDDAVTVGEFSVDVTGSFRLSDALEVHGSAASGLLQAGMQIDLRPDLALLLGAETVEMTAADRTVMQFSVGIRKGLSVPVPFPVQRAVEGEVFLDMDGDGVRGPHERPMDGVRLTMGGRTVTTRRGHFSFPAGVSRTPVTIDMASLGDGYIPPAPVSAGSGRLQIPVHRAASLRVEAFLDRNRDGFRDASDGALPGLTIEVSTSGIGWSLRTTEDGDAELADVRPGQYRAVVDPAALPREALQPAEMTVALSGGETRTLLIAVAARQIAFLD
jgi:hypothetical protein